MVNNVFFRTYPFGTTGKYVNLLVVHNKTKKTKSFVVKKGEINKTKAMIKRMKKLRF